MCMQLADNSPSKPKPLVIHFSRDAATQKPQGFQHVPIKKHVPSPYKSDKAVPWRYTLQKPDGGKDTSVAHAKDDPSPARVTNIFGTSRMTRSGRIFAAPELPVRSKDPKGKAKEGMEENGKASLILDEEVPAGRFAKEEKDFSKKGISIEEATEFLCIIQQSEFKVIEQLNKTPAINPAYSCLLGRPWIHSVGIVPSTLHQKLKFMVEGHLIIVSGEEDILVSCLSSTPYMEAAEESLETSFQTKYKLNFYAKNYKMQGK